ncbi:MAG: hypothetical protein OJF61_000995 [Rhodanobacteraceae bacterium]|nr:MAG: hypothetical protein OJF61_000995 [Rhodanobacteraceae bacterium]
MEDALPCCCNCMPATGPKRPIGLYVGTCPKQSSARLQIAESEAVYFG